MKSVWRLQLGSWLSELPAQRVSFGLRAASPNVRRIEAAAFNEQLVRVLLSLLASSGGHAGPCSLVPPHSRHNKELDPRQASLSGNSLHLSPSLPVPREANQRDAYGKKNHS